MAESTDDMPDSEGLSFNQLPLEILHVIFHYLDIPDILRTRRVSRYLKGVSQCREVWSDAYRNADFVRPPGPFLSQSAHELESALVPSYRVDRNLGKEGPTEWEKSTLKLREIRYTGVTLRVNLVFGRFLFVALSEEVRCYDLSLDAFDSNSGATIIYRSTGGTLTSFHAVSAIDVEGHPFACVVFGEVTQTGPSGEETTQISIYSLNVVERSEVTLDLLHQFEGSMFEICTVRLGPRVILVEGRLGPAVDADWRVVALEVKTRTQFLLPSFDQAMWQAPGVGGFLVPEWTTFEEITWPTSVSTSTHLLVARSYYTKSAGWSSFIQAFALPPLDTQRCLTPLQASLGPSHEGIIHGIDVRDAVLLHDAVLDAPTQHVFVSLRVYAFEPSRPRGAHYKYGILCLSGTARTPSPDKVGKITFQVVGTLGLAHMPFLHPSFNGAGRAFYSPTPGIVAALEYKLRGTGGGGSKDERPGAKVIEYPSILRFPSPHVLLDYDQYSGRVCLRSAMAKYSVIEILDLAV